MSAVTVSSPAQPRGPFLSAIVQLSPSRVRSTAPFSAAYISVATYCSLLDALAVDVLGLRRPDAVRGRVEDGERRCLLTRPGAEEAPEDRRAETQEQHEDQQRHARPQDPVPTGRPRQGVARPAASACRARSRS